jgi:hypothetical protein
MLYCYWAHDLVRPGVLSCLCVWDIPSVMRLAQGKLRHHAVSAPPLARINDERVSQQLSSCGSRYFAT